MASEQWTYNQKTQRYQDSGGTTLSPADLRILRDYFVDAMAAIASGLAMRFKAGDITLAMFVDAMQEINALTVSTMYMLGRGGINAMTPDDWNAAIGRITEQQAYLSNWLIKNDVRVDDPSLDPGGKPEWDYDVVVEDDLEDVADELGNEIDLDLDNLSYDAMEDDDDEIGNYVPAEIISPLEDRAKQDAELGKRQKDQQEGGDQEGDAESNEQASGRDTGDEGGAERRKEDNELDQLKQQILDDYASGNLTEEERDAKLQEIEDKRAEQDAADKDAAPEQPTGESETTPPSDDNPDAPSVADSLDPSAADVEALMQQPDADPGSSDFPTPDAPGYAADISDLIPGGKPSVHDLPVEDQSLLYVQWRVTLYVQIGIVAYGEGQMASSGLHLPILPGDGQTVCGPNCRCHLLFEVDDSDSDYPTTDITWETEDDNRMCADCEQMGEDWSPLTVDGAYSADDLE